MFIFFPVSFKNIREIDWYHLHHIGHPNRSTWQENDKKVDCQNSSRKKQMLENQIFAQNVYEKNFFIEKSFGGRNELMTWKHDYQPYFCMNSTNLKIVYQYLTPKKL